VASIAIVNFINTLVAKVGKRLRNKAKRMEFAFSLAFAEVTFPLLPHQHNSQPRNENISFLVASPYFKAGLIDMKYGRTASCAFLIDISTKTLTNELELRL